MLRGRAFTPAELTDSRPETVGAPRRNVGGAQGPRTRRSVPAETSCSRPPLTSDPWLQSEKNAQQRRGSASETAGSSAPSVLSAPLNLRGGRLDVPDPGQRWTAKVSAMRRPGQLTATCRWRTPWRHFVGSRSCWWLPTTRMHRSRTSRQAVRSRRSVSVNDTAEPIGSSALDTRGKLSPFRTHHA